jgi:beta-glucosidase
MSLFAQKTNSSFLKKFSLILLLGGFFILNQFNCVCQEKTKSVSKDLSQYDKKIESIISGMTLEEKIAMLHGNGIFSSAGIERLGIPDLKYADGPTGIREELEKNSWNPLKATNDSATFFPSGSALAATWSTDAAYLFGVGVGQEARTRGKDVLLGPAINITRIPNGGRTFEYLGEDPLLNAKIAVGYVKGVQDQGTAACIKHYAMNNQETNRGMVNVVADERTMREIYLPPFEAAVKEGNAYTVMAAYNKINGDWCAENDNLLNQILKKEWDFKGLVVSDWGGTHSSVKSAKNGLEVEMGSGNRNFMGQPLLDSVKAGIVPIEVINEKVKRILRVRFAIEPKEQTSAMVSTPEHSKIAYQIASQSIVLLKNVESLLPIDLNIVKKIAVIGDNATHKHAIGGFGAGVKTKYEITPLMGLKDRVGDRATIEFAQGYKPVMARGMGGRGNRTIEVKPDTTLLKEAVELAKNSDIVIFLGGTNREYETEGTDRANIKLPFGQDEVIAAVAAANPKTIVVMVAASPLELNEVVQNVPTVLFSWFNGSEGGNALADVLLGTVNPSGKLPLTFPASLKDSPAFANGSFPGGKDAVYKEGLLVGYRWFTTKNIRPLFPFGYGLSYTTFLYNGISTNKEKYKGDETIQVSVELKNSGNKDGDEVVQLYVNRVGAKTEWPVKELKGFCRVTLKAGETKKVTIPVSLNQLRYWDEKAHGWKLEDGKIQLMVGSSSEDIRLAKVLEI